MIDPIRPRAEAALSLPSTGIGSTPARIMPLLSARPDQLLAELVAGRQFSPAQTQQIVALVRATLEVFAAPAPDGHVGGTVHTLQVAVAALGELQRELTAELARHQGQVRMLAPIFQSLLLNADEPLPQALHALANLTQHDEGPILTRGDVRGTPPANGSTPAAPLPRTAPPAALSMAGLVQSLAEAVARLQESLSSPPLFSAGQPRETAPPPPGRLPVVLPPTDVDGPPAGHGLAPVDPPAGQKPRGQIDPREAFRWLLDAAVTHSATLAPPLPSRRAAGPLAPLLSALLEELAKASDVLQTVSPFATLPKAGEVNTATQFPALLNGSALSRTPAQPVLRDPRGDLATVLDRYPAVVRLLTPILRELGLAPAPAQPGLASASAQAFVTALARIQVLALVIQIEAEELGTPVLNRQVVAELEAAGMPPFSPPVDSADSIETYRWLLIAAQLYNTWRLTPRPPLQRCTRCGAILRRTRIGPLTCPNCP